MKNISVNIQSKVHSSYISICGSLTGIDAIDLKGDLSALCHSGKDLYLDIKDLEQIDLCGLTALLNARQLTINHGGETYIFVNKDNPIFSLLTKIKFGNQLNFRDCIIMDPYISIAS